MNTNGETGATETTQDNHQSDQINLVEHLKNSDAKSWNEWIREQREQVSYRRSLLFRNADLSACDFSGFDFVDCNFYQSSFNNCKLRNTNFSETSLEDVSFVQADLSFANLEGAGTYGADFSGAVIEGIKADPILTGSPHVLVEKITEESPNRDRTSLTRRIIEVTHERQDASELKPNPEHLHRLNTAPDRWNDWYAGKQRKDCFFYAKLAYFKPKKEGFFNCTLDLADLRYASLKNVMFSNSSISFANLTGADLRGADLSEVGLTGTILRHANLTDCILPSDPLDEELTQGARFDDPFNKHAPKPEITSLEEQLLFDTTDNTSTEDPISANPDSSMSIGEPIVDEAEIERTHKKLSDLVENAQHLKDGLQEVFDKANTNSHNLIGSMEGAKTQEITLSDTIKRAEDVSENAATLIRELSLIEDNFGTFVETQKKETIGSIKASLKPELEAAKDEVRAGEILEEAVQAWEDKFKTHNGAFKIGAGLFVTIIILLAALVAENRVQVLELLKTFAADKNYLGAFAIVSVPVAAIAWILRLVSRFTLQNLNLAHDAQQRKVSIDTYTRLVGTPNAIVEETDRAIMLNAIFRPIPGTSQPDIAPPSLLDLVGKKGS